MIDNPLERDDTAFDNHTMTITLVSVTCLVLPVEHRTRRIEGAAQRSPADPVHEPSAIACRCIGSHEVAQFRHKFVAELIIRIKRKYPRSGDLGESKIALAGEII